jgi:hypothetical protein
MCAQLVTYCDRMRTSRLSIVVAGLLILALPALSMGTPAAASNGGSQTVRSALATATMGAPYVVAEFNHPSKGGPQQGTDWRVIGGTFAAMTDYAPYVPDVPKVLLQVSMFRISDTNLAQSLVNDANAGLTVQVLLNGAAATVGCHGAPHCISPTFTILEQLNTINHEAGRSGTWLKTCAGYGPDHPSPLAGSGNGCLGQLLNHNKFMLASAGDWSDTGVLRDLVFQTSSNDVKGQYNDAFNNGLLIANRSSLYHDYQRYFTHLARAYRSTRPTRSQRFTGRSGSKVDEPNLKNHDIQTLSYPRAANNDPLLTALRSVSTANRCANPSTNPNDPAHTTIYLGMFAISGRNAALQELANLAHAGCRIHIVYTNIARAAYHTVHRRHVTLQQLCTTKTNQHQPRYFVHSKYLLIAGTTQTLGRNRRIIYTGSENFTTASLTASDNRDIRYVEPATDAPIYTAYLQNFQQMQTLGAHRPELGDACSAPDND